MKDKIEQIVGKVESGHLEPKEAVDELFDLCVVSQQRELLKFFIETQASELFKTETGFKWREDMIEETIKNFNRG
jgi:hypothetical protein